MSRAEGRLGVPSPAVDIVGRHFARRLGFGSMVVMGVLDNLGQGMYQKCLLVSVIFTKNMLHSQIFRLKPDFPDFLPFYNE